MNLNLGGIGTEAFLRDYWQKKPCLVRCAIPVFSSFMSRTELFDLSCDGNVESRLVIENDGDYPWQVLHGPFSPEELQNLPASHWSLLIQNMELHRDEAAELLDRFNFIPNWRIDDLMISLAPDQGSVGPHLDSYDVFLLQAQGRRCWQINPHAYDENDFIPGLDLRILDRFRSTEEWILDPGDMLYLPPGVAHYGVALGECQTYSIGLRAPSSHELLNHYLDEIIATMTNDYYADPDLRLVTHPGEITGESLARINSLLRSSLPDPATLETWFGKYVTRLPDQFHLDLPVYARSPGDFMAFFQEAGTLLRHRACRSAYIRRKDGFLLFINGDAFNLPLVCADFIQRFTESRTIDYGDCDPIGSEPAFRALVCNLYNRGLLYRVEHNSHK